MFKISQVIMLQFIIHDCHIHDVLFLPIFSEMKQSFQFQLKNLVIYRVKSTKL